MSWPVALCRINYLVELPCVVNIKQLMPKPKIKTKTPARLSEWTRLGAFQLGNLNVDVILDWDRAGGELWLRGSGSGLPRLRIGCDNTWGDSVGVLVHEAAEMILVIENARYRLTDKWGQNHADYVFHFDHNIFTRLSDMLGIFLVEVLPKFSSAWHARKALVKRVKSKVKP